MIVEDTGREKKRYRLSKNQWSTLRLVGDNIVDIEAIVNEVSDGEEAVQRLWDLGLIYRVRSRVVSLARIESGGLRDSATEADRLKEGAEFANGLAPAGLFSDRLSTPPTEAIP